MNIFTPLFRVSIPLLALGSVFFNTSVGAETFVAPKLTGPIVDEVGLIERTARENLEGQLRALSESGRAQVVILVTNSLQDLDIADYGIRLADAWKIGFKGGEKGKDANRDRGAILIVAPTERAMRIEVGYGLEGEIPDVTASRILEEVMKPRFKAGRFSEGIVEGAQVLIKLAEGDGSQAFPARKSASRRVNGSSFMTFLMICFFLSRMKIFAGLPLAGVVGYIFGAAVLGSGILVMIAAILLSSILRMIPSSVLGHHGGRLGGGGFGGGLGGGGGFGGGGGGFGGGGASSRW